MTDQPEGAPPAAPEPTGYTPPVFEPQVAPPAPPAKRRVWPWVLGGGIVLFLALVAIGVVVLINVVLGTGGAAQARQAVLDFDRAFATSDCDLFERVTSSGLRDSIYDGAYDCATFEANADSFQVDGDYLYQVEITSAEVDGDDATVRTTETDGAAEEPESFDFVYTLERTDGAWVITTLE